MKFFVSTTHGETGFYIQTVPNASQNRVVGLSEYQGHITLKVSVASPPVDNKANNNLVRYMAEYFDLPKNSVSLIKGHTSRLKLLSFNIQEKDLAEKFRTKGLIICQ